MRGIAAVWSGAAMRVSVLDSRRNGVVTMQQGPTGAAIAISQHECRLAVMLSCVGTQAYAGAARADPVMAKVSTRMSTRRIEIVPDMVID